MQPHPVHNEQTPDSVYRIRIIRSVIIYSTWMYETLCFTALEVVVLLGINCKSKLPWGQKLQVNTTALHIQATTLALLSKCEMKKHIRCENELSKPSSMKRLVTFSFLPEVNILHLSSCWAATSLKPAEELLSSVICLRWGGSSGVKNRLVEHKSWKSFRKDPFCAICDSILTIIWHPGKGFTVHTELLSCSETQHRVSERNLFFMPFCCWI